MVNRIILNETSYFGFGAIGKIADEMKRRGWGKAFIVTDKVLVECGVAGKVQKVLDDAGIPYDTYDDVKENPTIANVQNGYKRIQAFGADCVIGVGGGSSMDTAKAIAMICTNPDHADVRSLEGDPEGAKPCLPVIAVTTTAGTAAEVTINYVITDEENHRKMVCTGPCDIPVIAVVDPDMMMTMPASLAAATGMDALTHAIEGYITKGAWTMTDMVELYAIQLIASSLRDSVAKASPEAREQMAYGQYIAGMGFSNVGLGIVHGMAHPLGAVYDIPHGVANALLLPMIMEFNAPACGEKYRDIARAMGVPGTEGMDETTYKKAAVDAVRQLALDVKIPQQLSGLGVKAEDIDMLAEMALADPCTGGNPRDVTKEELAELYRKAL